MKKINGNKANSSFLPYRDEGSEPFLGVEPMRDTVDMTLPDDGVTARPRYEYIDGVF